MVVFDTALYHTKGGMRMFKAFLALWTKPTTIFRIVWESGRYKIFRAANNITHLLYDKASDIWVIIDPTLGTARGLRGTEWAKKKFVGVLITHPHIDHTADARRVSSLLKCPIYCTKKQRHMLCLGSYIRDISGMVQGWMKFLVLPIWLVIKTYTGRIRPRLVKKTISDMEIELIESGGHSPGDVLICGQGFVFIGDLFLCVTQRNIFSQGAVTGHDKLIGLKSLVRITEMFEPSVVLVPAHEVELIAVAQLKELLDSLAADS